MRPLVVAYGVRGRLRGSLLHFVLINKKGHAESDEIRSFLGIYTSAPREGQSKTRLDSGSRAQKQLKT